MNILFATIAFPENIEHRNIYTDLMEELRDQGHDIHVVSACERRNGKQTHLKDEKGIQVLSARTWNLKKTPNPIEKGLATLLVDRQFRKAIETHWRGKKFDLVLYSTPPITLDGVVRYIKKRDKARSYLLLKDIFPQNAVDIGLLKKGGLLHRYFAFREKRLYKTSDHIGCMSQANVEFLRKNHPYIPEDKIEVCPNSIRPKQKKYSAEERQEIRDRYHIPRDAIVFIYGGNLGKPQGIRFLEKVLEANSNHKRAFFLIVGSGTEYERLDRTMKEIRAQNMALYPYMPRNDFDLLLGSSNVGMIFLDPRFTIPNFPSRLLAYMEHSLPILAATDKNTDVGKVITEGGFGFWCESGDLDTFNLYIDRLCGDERLRSSMGERSHQCLLEKYTVSKTAETILSHFSKGEQNV